MTTSKTMEQVVLKDGSKIMIRPIRPDDAPRLQAFHTRLSEESILFRFLGHPKVLSDEQARELANVDHQNTMALVATVAEKDDERLIGVARYSLIPVGKPGRAEAAIIVEDAYQNRGVGAILSNRLIVFASHHGIRTFVSFIFSENIQVLRLLRRCGLKFDVVGQEGDLMEIHIPLSPKPDR